MSTVQESGLHRQSLYLWYSFKAPKGASKQVNALENEPVWKAMLELVKEAHLRIPGQTLQTKIAGKSYEIARWQLSKPGVPLPVKGDILFPIVFQGSSRFSPKHVKALKEACEQCAHQVATQFSVTARLVRMETETEIHKIVTKQLDQYL